MIRTCFSTMLVMLMALAVPTAIAAPASNESASMLAAQDTVTIFALDSLFFMPSEVLVEPGQEVLVVNAGSLEHRLVVDAWGIDTGPLSGGGSARFTVPADAPPGTSVEFRCTSPGHTEAGQTGTFTVTDGSPLDTPTTSATSTPAAVPQITGLISASDMRFAPDDVEVYPGQVIGVRNDGVLWHGLVVDEWGIDTGELDPAAQTIFTVPETAEVGSSVTFYCPVPGHRGAGLEGRFTVIAPPSVEHGSAIATLGAAVAESMTGP